MSDRDEVSPGDKDPTPANGNEIGQPGSETPASLDGNEPAQTGHQQHLAQTVERESASVPADDDEESVPANEKELAPSSDKEATTCTGDCELAPTSDKKATTSSGDSEPAPSSDKEAITSTGDSELTTLSDKEATRTCESEPVTSSDGDRKVQPSVNRVISADGATQPPQVLQRKRSVRFADSVVHIPRPKPAKKRWKRRQRSQTPHPAGRTSDEPMPKAKPKPKPALKPTPRRAYSEGDMLIQERRGSGGSFPGASPSWPTEAPLPYLEYDAPSFTREKSHSLPDHRRLKMESAKRSREHIDSMIQTKSLVRPTGEKNLAFGTRVWMTFVFVFSYATMWAMITASAFYYLIALVLMTSQLEDDPNLCDARYLITYIAVTAFLNLVAGFARSFVQNDMRFENRSRITVAGCLFSGALGIWGAVVLHVFSYEQCFSDRAKEIVIFSFVTMILYFVAVLIHFVVWMYRKNFYQTYLWV